MRTGDTIFYPLPRRTEEPAAIAPPTWESPWLEALPGSKQLQLQQASGKRERYGVKPGLEVSDRIGTLFLQCSHMWSAGAKESLK